MMAQAGVLDEIDETCREYERVVDLNIWKKSGRQRKNLPRRASLAIPDLPSAQYEILKRAKIRLRPVLSES
jgi:hypothetical protein